METIPMKIVSIKRLFLALTLGLASVMTLPAHAWPDTDEMNMCGAAVKNVRSYGGNHRGWAEHDNYIAQRGNAYYYRTNCPQSKAIKNYKGKNWAPRTKKMRVKHKMHKKHMQHKKHMYKHHKKYLNKHHKNHTDCVRVDRMNNGGATVRKATRRSYQSNDVFYRQAQAVLNMSRVKHVSKVHNPKHKNHADCLRTDGLNNGGSVVRVVRKR